MRLGVMRSLAVAVPLALVLGSVGAAVAKPTPTAPPTLTGTPDKVTNATSAAFTWTVVNGTTYTCNLDGTSTACTSSWTKTGLAAGAHTFVLKAKAAGKPAATSYSWTVDLTPPVAPTIAALPSPTSNPVAAVSWTDADPAVVRYTCAIDNGPAALCTSPKTYSGLSEGSHTVTVRAVDAAGNEAPASRSWVVDHTAPFLVSVSGPASPTKLTAASATFSGEPGATFTCSLDGAGASACTSPWSASGLGEGAHALTVTPIDGAANAGVPATVSWTIDLTPPGAPTKVSGPPATSGSPSAEVHFVTAAGTSSVTCAFNGAVAAPCTSPWTVNGLTDLSSNTLSVVGYDVVGNASTPLTVTWSVDLAAPSPAYFVAGPASPSRDTNPAFDFANTDATTSGYECALDGGAFSGCDPDVAGGLHVPVSGDGAHALAVRALDSVGNASATVDWSWVLDTTAPAVPALSGPSGTVASTVASFGFTTDDATATFSCSLDGSAAGACLSPTGLTGLSQGGHSFAVTATDAAGNTATSSASWAVDTVGPVVDAVPPSSPTNASSVPVGFSSADAVSFSCAFDGAAAAPCTSPQTLPAGGDGTHQLVVTGTDAVGNVGVPTVVSWEVDRTGPGTPVADPATVYVRATSVAFSFLSAGADHYTCALDAAAAAACTSPVLLSGLAQGAHTLHVTAYDVLGNASATLDHAFVVDSARPTVTVTLPAVLTGATRATFSESVTGVSTSTLKLAVKGATSPLSARVTCLSATNTVVSCTGPVRSAVVTPVSRLVAGQYYTATVSTLTDVAGNALLPKVVAFRAARVVQDNDLSMSQGWAVRSSTAALGGRYVLASKGGATASYAFRGTGLVWYTATGPTMGTAKVYCGSTYKGTVNNYASAAHWRVARTVRCSSAVANNTLQVVATGLKGSSAGKGTNVVLDAVKVGTTTVSNPSAPTRWAGVSASAASGKRYAVADESGAVVSLVFRGTSVTWQTVLGPTMGKATVYVDGVKVATYDGWAASAKYGVRRVFAKRWNATTKQWVAMNDAVHTLKIVPTGTSRTGATGKRVAVDLLTVA
jgi:hypothetical protein